jgi:hypothetical protein
MGSRGLGVARGIRYTAKQMSQVAVETRTRARALAMPRGSFTGKQVVLWTIALLVLARFPAEELGIFPGFFKLLDIPLVILLAVAAATHPRAVGARAGYFVPSVLFVGVAAVSVVLNLTRVAPGPVVVFLYGFLAPIVAYGAAYRLWPPGHISSLTRVVVALGVIELVVVALLDMPRFLSSGNPDDISGTFGENAYQLVFFLILFCAFVAALAIFEPGRWAARMAPILIAGSLGTIFLAQYRALFFTTALSILVIGGLLFRSGGRGFALGTYVLATFVIVLAFVIVRFPATKYAPYLADVRQSPLTIVWKRVQALSGVVGMYDHIPQTVLTGSGPGTFSSRAWQTFSNLDTARSRTDPVSQLVNRLTGGKHYHTDVSDQYSSPKDLASQAILGSKAVTSPFSSYTSLLAEVGVLGCLLLIGIYVGATVRAFRLARFVIAAGKRPNVLVAPLVASAIALSVLLQMALLGNWLEVARITIPSWIVFAVALKEFRASRLTGEK